MSKNLTALSFEGESGLKHHQLAMGIFYGTSNESANAFLHYYDFNPDPYFNRNETITLDQFREFLYEKYNYKTSAKCSVIGFSPVRGIFCIYYNDTKITITIGDVKEEEITKITIAAAFSY